MEKAEQTTKMMAELGQKFDALGKLKLSHQE